jgi:multidrug efflux pump subunit AcrA (membrane-fusion protein)
MIFSKFDIATKARNRNACSRWATSKHRIASNSGGIGILLLAALAILLAVGGWYIIKSKMSLGARKQATEKVKRKDLLQRVTIGGTVSSLRKGIIAAPYNGYVRKVFVTVGQVVQAGDPLVSVGQSLQAQDTVFPLRAPFAGTVVQIEKAAGEFVKENDSKEFILRIDDMSKLFVLANAPEIERTKIKVGQAVEIRAAAIVSKVYHGVIRELTLAAKGKEDWGRSQAIEFPAKIEILDKDEQIRPGMSVLIDIVSDQREKVLTLPHEYLRKEGDQSFVLLSSGQRKDIKVGLQNEEGFEILEGLSEGDEILQIDFYGSADRPE